MRKIKLFLLIAVSALSAGFAAHAQNITVTGVVTDGAGDPVPAAAVIVDGSKQGTSADLDGKYSISVPANGTLVFSSIGFVEQKVAVNGRRVINVSFFVGRMCFNAVTGFFV